MGSTIRQCKSCGQLFQSFGADICPECAEELDRCFSEVKRYVYDHPEATVMDIVQGTGVEEKTVLRFLREGRLSVNAPEGSVRCEECGAPITGGRFCSVCRSRLEGLLNGAYRPEAGKKSESGGKAPLPGPGRMHVRHQNK